MPASASKASSCSRPRRRVALLTFGKRSHTYSVASSTYSLARGGNRGGERAGVHVSRQGACVAPGCMCGAAHQVRDAARRRQLDDRLSQHGRHLLAVGEVEVGEVEVGEVAVGKVVVGKVVLREVAVGEEE